jgi:hypothetical protein
LQIVVAKDSGGLLWHGSMNLDTGVLSGWTALAGSTLSLPTLASNNGASDNSTFLTMYSNRACTIPISNIDWGQVYPGGNKTTTIYIKNTSGSPLTLSMTTNNWNPAIANGPLTITWTRNGTTIAPQQSIRAPITLTVSSSITSITSFSVQIRISGTG